MCHCRRLASLCPSVVAGTVVFFLLHPRRAVDGCWDCGYGLCLLLMVVLLDRGFGGKRLRTRRVRVCSTWFTPRFTLRRKRKWCASRAAEAERSRKPITDYKLLHKRREKLRCIVPIEPHYETLKQCQEQENRRSHHPYGEKEYRRMRERNGRPAECQMPKKYTTMFTAQG
ncbi:pre-mRNA 3'-end-processing factor FIP1 [Anopheles sinensis]|uniref:Pre-mRNA 3'-end-processing factor FIP1 n=1 Tax=Anopheles sinensis TaxID=74873 RepID=A0A084VV00_ANOSI|nr:pre-mRNA 3'-end-processing factor FIP1 [Anopheles sinensis]